MAPVVVVVVLVLLELLLVVVVIVHCGALPEANQHAVVDSWRPVWLVRVHRQKLISTLSWTNGGPRCVFILVDERLV